MARAKVKTGAEVAWKWVIVAVALTFLGIYLLNNLKPGKFVEPVVVPGYSSYGNTLPTDAELVPLGEEWQQY